MADLVLPLVPGPQTKLVHHHLQLGPIKLTPVVVHDASCGSTGQVNKQLMIAGQEARHWLQTRGHCCNSDVQSNSFTHTAVHQHAMWWHQPGLSCCQQ